MVRWCWVNFQCRGVLLIWIIVGQGPTALAVGAGGGCFTERNVKLTSTSSVCIQKHKHTFLKIKCLSISQFD